MAGRSVYDTSSPAAEVILGVLVGAGAQLSGGLAGRPAAAPWRSWAGSSFVVGYITATASVMGMLVIPAVPILIAVIIYLHTQQRRNQQNGLLWVLAVAADREIPLAPGVEAYSQQNHGIYRERTHALAALLQAWTVAVRGDRMGPPGRPVGRSALDPGRRATGQLAHGLREAAETRAKRHESLRDRVRAARLSRCGIIALRRGSLGSRPTSSCPSLQPSSGISGWICQSPPGR